MDSDTSTNQLSCCVQDGGCGHHLKRPEASNALSLDFAAALGTPDQAAWRGPGRRFQRFLLFADCV
jgi:hypothetical protein